MKKKALALVLSVAMMATLFTACGGSDSASSSTATTDTSSTESTEAASTDTEVVGASDEELAEHVTIKWYLEGSNVNVATEMVNLIVAQRAYEMNSTAIQTTDEMMQTANGLKR